MRNTHEAFICFETLNKNRFFFANISIYMAYIQKLVIIKIEELKISGEKGHAVPGFAQSWV